MGVLAQCEIELREWSVRQLGLVSCRWGWQSEQLGISLSSSALRLLISISCSFTSFRRERHYSCSSRSLLDLKRGESGTLSSMKGLHIFIGIGETAIPCSFYGNFSSLRSVNSRWERSPLSSSTSSQSSMALSKGISCSSPSAHENSTRNSSGSFLSPPTRTKQMQFLSPFVKRHLLGQRSVRQRPRRRVVSGLEGGRLLVDQTPMMGKLERLGSKIMRWDLSMLRRPQVRVEGWCMAVLRWSFLTYLGLGMGEQLRVSAVLVQRRVKVCLFWARHKRQGKALSKGILVYYLAPMGRVSCSSSRLTTSPHRTSTISPSYLISLTFMPRWDPPSAFLKFLPLSTTLSPMPSVLPSLLSPLCASTPILSGREMSNGAIII